MNPEHGRESTNTPEASTAELQELAREQLDKLSAQPEASPEQQSENADKAREIIEKHAEQPPRHDRERTPHNEPTHRNPFINYMHTMASLRRRLSPASRRFSDVIHNPTVEQVSEVMERTIMRPSVTLGATSTALLVGTVLYVTARHYGFRLSGSELILSLVLGGTIGAIIELAAKTLHRRPRR